MPPKIKITRNDIVKTAVQIVREGGIEVLNARGIAEMLNCSTQPIFSNFATMDELNGAVLSAVYGIYLDFLEKEARDGKYPQYKAFGMAYIRFALEESRLFKLLFMCDTEGRALLPTSDFEQSVSMIVKSTGLSESRARLLHLEMWTAVHGIATMLATSFLNFDWELISDMLTDIYRGLCIRHSAEDKK